MRRTPGIVPEVLYLYKMATLVCKLNPKLQNRQNFVKKNKRYENCREYEKYFANKREVQSIHYCHVLIALRQNSMNLRLGRIGNRVAHEFLILRDGSRKATTSNSRCGILFFRTQIVSAKFGTGLSGDVRSKKVSR